MRRARFVNHDAIFIGYKTLARGLLSEATIDLSTNWNAFGPKQVSGI